MRVLGIETSTTSASIAIVSPERTVSKTYVIGERRSTDLLVGIDELCVQLGIAPRELEAVAVGAGPGSFTGLRIGMATAKGIAFAAQRPLWSVSSLAVLAVAERKPAVCAVLDARRGEVFAGCYRGATLVGEERVMNPAELVAWAESQLGADVAFAGDALDKYPELSPLAARWTVATPSSIVVAELALAGPRTDVLTSGAPMYIRASEAEIRYPDGVPGALRKR
jgi:tRNA threonylcarbamoyladenosine biosynthesis protein TsaB